MRLFQWLCGLLRVGAKGAQDAAPAASDDPVPTAATDDPVPMDYKRFRSDDIPLLIHRWIEKDYAQPGDEVEFYPGKNEYHGDDLLLRLKARPPMTVLIRRYPDWVSLDISYWAVGIEYCVQTKDEEPRFWKQEFDVEELTFYEDLRLNLDAAIEDIFTHPSDEWGDDGREVGDPLR